jgi:hypothetical protein
MTWHRPNIGQQEVVVKVSVNILKGNGSAEKTCAAMAKGIARCGDDVAVRTDLDNRMEGFDVAILWGFVASCQNVIKSCRTAGIPFLFFDMGYWARDKGFFKVACNDRHPDKYFMRRPKPADRFNRLGLTIEPWQRNTTGYILLAGMSGKASWSWGWGNEDYERRTIAELRKYTDRPIVYRPKPSWSAAKPLSGARFDVKTPLRTALAEAHCVVSHHSNVGCDALLAGVPTFNKLGAASILGPYELRKIEKPNYPEGREQWAHNLAYCQWSLAEMTTGECWDFFKRENFMR